MDVKLGARDRRVGLWDTSRTDGLANREVKCGRSGQSSLHPDIAGNSPENINKGKKPHTKAAPELNGPQAPLMVPGRVEMTLGADRIWVRLPERGDPTEVNCNLN